MTPPTKTPMSKTSSSAPLDDTQVVTETGKLALALGNFLTRYRTENGKSASEGLVYGALGVLFASTAKDDAQCLDIQRNLSIAVNSAYRMKGAK